MKKILPLLLLVFLFSFTTMSCGEEAAGQSETETEKSVKPAFNADSAYAYVARQCSFGPRVPGSEAHRACGDWLVAQLKAFGADTVYRQTGETTLYDGRKMQLLNIIASFNSEASNRVMLCAHWDSRPFADEEAQQSARQQAIMGADDGASGVGVLLEAARILGQQKPNIGVDIMLFDLEDWGAPEWETSRRDDHGWCLGSQYWAARAHQPGYRAQYGILLDMVGGNGSRFYREYFSEGQAKWLNDKVWDAAHRLSLDNRFVNAQGGAITDDHLPIMQIAKIPCIDIIAYNANAESGFPDYWHTTRDDMSNISRAALNDVGRVLIELIY